MPIKFGTDGWRDVIAEDFTFENVRLVARAHAQLLRQQGSTSVCVGFDTRFQGAAFAQVTAEVMANHGLDVWLADEYLPTPALSFAVVHLQAGGGVMITASHNPPQYSGYKIKGSYGGSATPDLIRRLETALQTPEAFPKSRGTIRSLDIRQAYYEQLDRQLNLSVLQAFQGKVIHDAMGGAACGWLTGYLEHAGLPLNLTELHGYPDPLFYGTNPEPIRQNLTELIGLLGQESGLTFGVVTDGDADRVGAVTAGGRVFNSHQIFAVLIRHLHQRGLRGRVVKTVSGSHIIDLLTQHLGLELLETPVGFKYITDAFLEGTTHPERAVMIGGEESGGLSTHGHIPERDGLLNSLLLIEAVASSGLSLNDLFSDIESLVGFTHHYDRADLHLEADFDRAKLLQTAAAIPAIANNLVQSVNSLDGIKLLLAEGTSVMFRPSGTEPVVRVYVEAQSPHQVQTLLQAAIELVTSAQKFASR